MFQYFQDPGNNGDINFQYFQGSGNNEDFVLHSILLFRLINPKYIQIILSLT